MKKRLPYAFTPLPDEIKLDRFDRSQVGEIVRCIRCDDQLTQVEFAENVGACASSIRNWEIATQVPNVYMFLDILDYGDYEVIVRRKKNE